MNQTDQSTEILDIDIVDIPEDEDISSLPDDITIEDYWKNNNTFLNGWDDGHKVCLAYRSSYSGIKLVKTIDDFRWYTHIHKEEWESLPPLIKSQIKKTANKVEPYLKYHRIYCDNESINEMYDDSIDARLRIKSILDRHGINMLEGDLKNYKRYCVDKQIQIASKFKIAFIDIETDDRHDGIVIGRDRILSFAYVNQDGEEVFHKIEEDSDEAEKKLMKKLQHVFQEYDILITWNGTNFDIPYIKERFEKRMGYRMSMKYIAHIDFMKRFQKLFQSDINIRSWGLDFICNYFLGEGKVKHEEGIYEMWEEKPGLFKKYNLHDARLLFKLEEKLKVLSLIILECQWTGTFPSKFYVSELLDNYILRQSNPKGVHFRPTSFSKVPKSEREEEGESEVAGGFVRDPVKGLHEWVHVFDFKSLYPTIMLTWNISQDTFYTIKPEDVAEELLIKTVNGYWTHRDKVGMVPTVIQKLLDARKEYKNKQLNAKFGTQDYEVAQGSQQVVKELANSMYGTMAQIGNRYYSKETAEAITLAGQHMSKFAGDVFKAKFDYNTLYGDTDSTFVGMMDQPDRDKIKLILKVIHEAFEEHVKTQFNVKKTHIVLEYEKKFRKIILLQKKQYVGRLIEVDGKAVDEIYGRGIEYVKKDTIAYAARLQKQMLRHLLYEENDVQFYHEFVRNEKLKFANGNISVEDLTINQKASKHPSKYAVKLAHIRIAEQRIKEGKEFYVGMMIPYIIVGTKPKLSGVHVEDYKGDFDRTYYWDVKTYHPLKRFLECVFPEEDWGQYEFEVEVKRDKKYAQYLKWLNDKKKASRKEEYIEKISKDEFLSPAQRKRLISIAKGEKPKFKLAAKSINNQNNGEQECQNQKEQKRSLNLRLRKPPTENKPTQT